MSTDSTRMKRNHQRFAMKVLSVLLLALGQYACAFLTLDLSPAGEQPAGQAATQTARAASWPTSRPLHTAQPPASAGATPMAGAGAASPTPHIPGGQEAACVPQEGERQVAEVVHVVDGDTIDVEIDGRTYAVRYIGIDAPEWTRQRERFGEQATERNRELVEDRTVLLVKDVSETDRHGRLLRYVFVGEAFVNDMLVREGYANAGSYPPDTACWQSFSLAEEEAQEQGWGLWED